MVRNIDLVTELGRLVRFSFVGILNSFLYIGVVVAAIEGFGQSPIVGSLIGQLVSVVVLYVGHLRYSFRLEFNRGAFLRRFLAVSAALSCMNVGITWLLTDTLGFSYRISTMLLTVLIPGMSYLLSRFWVFAPGLSPARAAATSASGKPDAPP